ncbi:MAG: FAD-dependent oxidoreductase [Legionellaceae bacterium]|nr:FAD-dependent oxidoreductase [Legionellaceae bacterium]
MKKRIAVIGAGISGLTCAYKLAKQDDVSLFEAKSYIGGHTNTIDIDIPGAKCAVDTGFIVFNERTYPNFCNLLEELKISKQLSEMSFSYRSDKRDLEYNGHSLNTMFADRRNLYSPDFYRLIKDIIRFNKDAKKYVHLPVREEQTIAEFLSANNYSETFKECYLIPMLSSIWSKKKHDSLNCSAYFIFKFYENHGLLDLVNRPPWFVIPGGSRNYIKPILKTIKNVHLDTPILQITPQSNGITLQSKNTEYNFDAVVCATHSDQALAMLDKPTTLEHDILSNIKYTSNSVVLHTDSSIMPKNKRAWASWNYLDNQDGNPCLTYYMNLLQSLDCQADIFVSMNLTQQIDKAKIIQTFEYAHPCLDMHAITKQEQINKINGTRGIYFAGAYQGFGFHEDGVNSALNVCSLLEGL